MPTEKSKDFDAVMSDSTDSSLSSDNSDSDCSFLVMPSEEYQELPDFYRLPCRECKCDISITSSLETLSEKSIYIDEETHSEDDPHFNSEAELEKTEAVAISDFYQPKAELHSRFLDVLDGEEEDSIGADPKELQENEDVEYEWVNETDQIQPTTIENIKSTPTISVHEAASVMSNIRKIRSSSTKSKVKPERKSTQDDTASIQTLTFKKPKLKAAKEEKKQTEKDMLKAWFEYNLLEQRKEDMANPNKGWKPYEPEICSDDCICSQIEYTAEDFRNEEYLRIKNEWLQYLEKYKLAIKQNNQNIFINSCLLLIIKQFIFEYARPRTATGRPLTGVVRPGTQRRPGSTLEALKTARPLTSQSSRAIRLGTAAMLSQKDGPFIQISRMNIGKYAREPCLSKPLFEYLFYCDGDVRNAMELAVQATQYCKFKDWWWKVQLAKCYVLLSLPREAEEQLRSALKQQNHIETFIRLSRIYIRLDQPLTALEICNAGLEAFPNDVSLLVEMARLHENLNNSSMSIKFYRSAVIEDAMNTESIACIGMYHFYNNQPELALRYYRRILAMGAHSAELYNNLGLSCLYSQQLDLTLSCFQRALDLATDPLIKAEVWFNLAHTALAAGDLELAMLCLNICVSVDPTHAPGFNNLAVLHQKMGHNCLAKVYFLTAKSLEEDMEETNANLELLQKK